APATTYPTAREMGDYLEAYALHHRLPLRTGIEVESLAREDGRLVAVAGDDRFEAENVVVATGTFQRPRVPSLADELDPGITQLHSSEYRNLSQLQDGPVLVVGASHSGADNGLPVLDDGRVLDVRNVVWCTGFRPDYSWIRVPFELGEDGYPVQYRGAVDSSPGLYFVGLPFLHSFASMLIGGAGRDAER